jgi:RHS repeat-associated protein
MYDYDPIGNRQSYTEGAAPPTTYTTNNVNKYPSTADPAESFLYDKDGNLIEDGDLLYSWDFENRLESVVPKSPGPGDVLLMFEYDYEMRRVRKVAYPWHDALGDWSTTPSRDIRFVYDGWNLLLELDGRDLTDGSGGGPDGQPDNTVIRKYTWGLDLSGTLQAAGGIGGLLAVEDANATPSDPGDDLRYLYFYDANGNVGQLADLADGSVDAKYEYNAYGSALLDPFDVNVSGPYASTNPYRFSTKYLDAETGMYNYGYRYYHSSSGRWLNRDPIGEEGAKNLLSFVNNQPIRSFDPLGLYAIDVVVRTWIDKTSIVYDPAPAPQVRHDYTWGALVGIIQSLTNDRGGGTARDKQYRIYSRAVIHFDCCKGQPKVTYFSLIIDNGDEGPFTTDPPNLYMRRIGRTGSGTAYVEYGVKARPNSLAELYFNAVQFRTAKYIWHEVGIYLYCLPNGIGRTHTWLDGSRFPSHSMFEDFQVTRIQHQDGMNWLWSVHPLDRSRVR